MFGSPYSGHDPGCSFTFQRSFLSVPPFGPLSSNAQPIVLPSWLVNRGPDACVTTEFAHARPPPIVVGTIARHVSFELKLPPATHWPSGTLRLPVPRTLPSRRYILTAK